MTRALTNCSLKSSPAACVRPTCMGGMLTIRQNFQKYSAMKAPVSSAPSAKGVDLQAGRPCRDGLSVVRRLPELQDTKTKLLPECIRLKMNGTRADGSTLHSKDGKPVYSAFFQQSSFGNFTIANERFAVKVRNDAPIEERRCTRLRRPNGCRRGTQCHETTVGG